MEVTEDAASPVKHASDLLENQQTLGLTGSTWGVEGGPDAAPTRGSTVIDRAGGDEKLGTLVAFSPGRCLVGFRRRRGRAGQGNRAGCAG